MPFVFLALGIVLLIVAVQGTHRDMFALLKSEFVGSNSFLVWVAAIAILGALGFIKPLRPAANAMLLLVLLVIVLRDKGGFFSQFNRAIRNPVAPSRSGGTAVTAAPSLPATITGPGSVAFPIAPIAGGTSGGPTSFSPYENVSPMVDKLLGWFK